MLVLGSAIGAFLEVCPERVDLLHPHFRKLCNMLADIDEWGQISLLNVLTRYARTHFASPNKPRSNAPSHSRPRKAASSFYSDEEEGDNDEDEAGDEQMDPDHRLLLRAATPLLQSRNSGVVVAASMLFYYCSPDAEVLKIGRPMVRLVRNPPQISYLALQNIVMMARTRPELFSTHVAEFFIYDTDPSYICGLKLEILTLIASTTNISRILKEFTVRTTCSLSPTLAHLHSFSSTT